MSNNGNRKEARHENKNHSTAIGFLFPMLNNADITVQSRTVSKERNEKKGAYNEKK
jgi:hypothetical protein